MAGCERGKEVRDIHAFLLLVVGLQEGLVPLPQRFRTHALAPPLSQGAEPAEEVAQDVRKVEEPSAYRFLREYGQVGP